MKWGRTSWGRQRQVLRPPQGSVSIENLEACGQPLQKTRPTMLGAEECPHSLAPPALYVVLQLDRCTSCPSQFGKKLSNQKKKKRCTLVPGVRSTKLSKLPRNLQETLTPIAGELKQAGGVSCRATTAWSQVPPTFTRILEILSDHWSSARSSVSTFEDGQSLGCRHSPYKTDQIKAYFKNGNDTQVKKLL